MNKRGISPLIATVLLISFTIVISVVITAWIRTGLEGQLASGSEKIASATACLSTKVDIPPSANKGICYDSSNLTKTRLKVFVDNKGDKEILDVYVRVINDDGSTQTFTGITLGRDGISEIDVPTSQPRFPLATLNRAVLAYGIALPAGKDVTTEVASVEVTPTVTEGICKEGSMDTFTVSISSPINAC